MNPLVQVSSAAGSIATPPEPSALEQYHVALVAGSSLAQLQRWDDACAAAGVPFFGAMSRGTAAFLFADLLEHSHTTEASPGCSVCIPCSPAATTLTLKGASEFCTIHDLIFVLIEARSCCTPADLCDRAAQVRKGSSVTTAKPMLSYVRLRQALTGSSASMHPKRTHKLAFVLRGALCMGFCTLPSMALSCLPPQAACVTLPLSQHCVLASVPDSG